jgi:hypothetical protein
MTTEIHLEDAATAMLSEWKAAGFNGVKFIACYMELSRLDDWISDYGDSEETRQKFEAHRRDYAIFVAHPNLSYEDSCDSPYVSVTVELGAFDSDLMKEIHRRLGDDVDIRYRAGCHEYEVIRKCPS